MKTSGLFLGIMLVLCVSLKAQILVEAESFENRGGWYLDHQAFNKIGSAYLMAHGMGVPVRDAVTYIEVKEAGAYHVYVNTFNWSSPWYAGEGPGAFNVVVNDQPLPEKIGVKGTQWGWQYAGKIKLKGKTKIALHDLTGFNGRVDAIYFSKEKKTPPSEFESLRKFRNQLLGNKEPEIVPNADLVVVGGGVAGCATALTAARYGLKVILIDNLPHLGGNNYLGVTMCGMMCYNLYPNLGKMVRELAGVPEEFHQYYGIERTGSGNGHLIVHKSDQEIAALRKRLLEEENVLLYQNTHIFEAESEGRKVVSVTGKNLLTNKEYLFKGKRFVDCTGDGVVGFLVGAEFHIGREPRSYANEPSAPDVADQKKMGSTLKWNAIQESEVSKFPTVEELPWAMQCSDKYHVRTSQYNWTWETGFEIDNALEPELVRDNMLRAIYGNWAYLKNHVDAYKNYRLEYVTHIAQKRESRRILGEFVLNENDIRNAVKYRDASFTTTWTLDLHFAKPDNSKEFPGWEWQSYCHNGDSDTWIRPYHVPYRVLFAKDFDNLFIGGRNMSVTHMALGTVRVMATLGMAGEVIGMAAKICNDYDIAPKEVYNAHLDQLIEMMKKGAPGASRKRV